MSPQEFELEALRKALAEQTSEVHRLRDLQAPLVRQLKMERERSEAARREVERVSFRHEELLQRTAYLAHLVGRPAESIEIRNREHGRCVGVTAHQAPGFKTARFESFRGETMVTTFRCDVTSVISNLLVMSETQSSERARQAMMERAEQEIFRHINGEAIEVLRAMIPAVHGMYCRMATGFLSCDDGRAVLSGIHKIHELLRMPAKDIEGLDALLKRLKGDGA